MLWASPHQTCLSSMRSSFEDNYYEVLCNFQDNYLCVGCSTCQWLPHSTAKKGHRQKDGWKNGSLERAINTDLAEFWSWREPCGFFRKAKGVWTTHHALSEDKIPDPTFVVLFLTARSELQSCISQWRTPRLSEKWLTVHTTNIIGTQKAPWKHSVSFLLSAGNMPLKSDIGAMTRRL